MPDQEPVIILDENGDEHEFPPGFDPVKAGVIVRNRPGANGIADTFSGGFHEALKKPGNLRAGRAVGVVEGVPEGVMGTLGAIPKVAIWGLQEALGGVLDAGNLALHPEQIPDALNRAYDNVKGMVPDADTAAHVKDWFEKAMVQSREDPEAFGRMVGNMLGSAATTGALAKVVPLGMKPIAAKVGGAVSETGRLSKWPLRIGGAHAVMGGNPAGIAMIAAPQLLEKYGEKLQRFGTAEGAALDTAQGGLLKLESDLKTGAMRPDQVRDQIVTMRQDLADRLSKAQLPKDLAALSKEQKALDVLEKMASPASPDKAAIRIAAQKEKLSNQFEDASRARDAEAAKLAQVEADKAGLVPGPKTVKEVVSAEGPGGTRVSSSQTFAPEEGPSETEQILANIERKNAELAARAPKPAVRIAPPANPVPTPAADAPAAYETENEAFRQRVQAKLDAAKRPVTAPAEAVAPSVEDAASTVTTPPAAKPAVRIAVPPVSLKSVTPGGLDRVAASLKQAFGDEIEQLRTEHGATEAAEILQKNHPAELGKMKRGELTTLIRKVSGGEAGLLPEGARAEIDAKMAGMDRAAQEAYLLKSGDKNAAAYKYVASKMGMQPND